MRHATILVLLATAQIADARPSGSDGLHAADDDDDDGDDIAYDRDPPPFESQPTRMIAPPIAAVLAAAYGAAGLDQDPGRSWIRRTRLAGLVPWVSIRTGRDTSWRDEEPTIGHGTTVEIRATWRLDRLVFDGRELQVASLESARRRERLRLANRVIRAYFRWRRAASATVTQPRWMSHAEESAADLDVLTAGWFTEAVVELRRAASEFRTPCCAGATP